MSDVIATLRIRVKEANDKWRYYETGYAVIRKHEPLRLECSCGAALGVTANLQSVCCTKDFKHGIQGIDFLRRVMA